MGCSPSRGHNLTGGQGPFRRGRALTSGSKENIGESQSDDGTSVASSCLGETDGEAWERGGGGGGGGGEKPILSHKEIHRRRPSLARMAPDGACLDKLGTDQIEINMVPRGTGAQGDSLDERQGKKGAQKPKKSKGSKPSRKKQKEKKASVIEPKVDFPEPLVKAHQAAYAFLNPSIAKYEVLLGLLDQAAQTQLSLQPLASFMALRYEEVNQGLKEMAEEGERLLKESGEHLTWPCPVKNLSDTPSIATAAAADTEPPPDLLQQLLQFTTQRMRLIGRSVGGIGDSALEEGAEFFASLSELLDEKLKAKRVLEAHLGQVLARVESAALRKPGPEDSALFSEDSGIGVESESLAGSEQLMRRCDSCESTSTTRTIRTSSSSANCSSPVRQGAARHRLMGKMSTSISLTSIDSTCTLTTKEEMQDTESLLGSASLDDGEGEGEEDEDEDDEEEYVGEVTSRKQSTSSQSNPCQPPRRMAARRIENPQNVEMTLKMKDAISGRIRFFPSQRPGGKFKQASNSPENSGVGLQWTEEEGERQMKRPQSATATTPTTSRGGRKKALVAKERRSRSAESLRSKAEDPTLLELERTQKDLSQRLERMGKGRLDGTTREAGPKRKGGGEQLQGAHNSSPATARFSSSLNRNTSVRSSNEKVVLRRHSSGEYEKDAEEGGTKRENKTGRGPLKATPPPGTPPSLPFQPSGLHRGRNSVKRLIDTFSQGVEEKQGQRSPKVLGPLRGVRKCGVPIIPGLGSGEAVLVNSKNNIHSCRADSRASDRMEDLDFDSLPPPPPEVLMDTSFECTQGVTVSGDGDDTEVKSGHSSLLQKTTVTQRLRASVQSVAVLPSRSSLRRNVSVSPARPISHNAAKPEAKPEADPETEEVASLYKQARKIIHLRHSVESPTNKTHTDSAGPRNPSPTRSGMFRRRGTGRASDKVPSTLSVNNQPPSTPPASRARKLPSTPSNPPSQHRRLPSPPTFKRQPTPPSATSPPATTPPPPGQRRFPSPVRKSVSPPNSQCKMPSPPASRREVTSNSIAGSYPFKTPSPPASPRFQRWTRENSSEEVVPLPPTISRGFSNARSVFCPASPSLFESQPCMLPQHPQAGAPTNSCVLPQTSGDFSRGRLPRSVRGPRPFIRRSHSDHRPSLTFPPRTLKVSVAQSCGSEPSISTKGLEDGPTREEELWGNQSDLRAANRSASHPDLCIVGQALQRE